MSNQPSLRRVLQPTHVSATGTNPIDYRHQYLISRSAIMGANRGWSIAMHEDAKVALEYLYQPDPSEYPEIALMQPDAPAPLIFTAGGWFSSPIEEKRLTPVESPK